MELIAQYHFYAFSMIGAKLMIRGIVPDKSTGTKAGGFMLAH